jgi:hypothetical protein
MTDTSTDANVNVNPNNYLEPMAAENIFFAAFIVFTLLFIIYLLKK